MSLSTASHKRAVIPVEGRKTRRAALGALVAAGALAIPTIVSIASSFADPIFSAVARHKSAYDAAVALRFTIDDIINNPEGRGVTEAEWEACDRAWEDEDATFDQLLACPPRTLAGTRAIIAHLLYLDDGRLSAKMKRLLALLLRSQALVA